MVWRRASEEEGLYDLVLANPAAVGQETIEELMQIVKEDLIDDIDSPIDALIALKDWLFDWAEPLSAAGYAFLSNIFQVETVEDFRREFVDSA